MAAGTVPQAIISRLENIFLTNRSFVRNRNYVGPDRRRRDDTTVAKAKYHLTDQSEDNRAARKPTHQKQKARRALLSDVNALVNALDGLDVCGRAAVLNFYHGTETLWTSTKSVGDQSSQNIADSLLHYIQSFGAKGMLKIVCIGEHLSAITRLLGPKPIPKDVENQLVTEILQQANAKLESMEFSIRCAIEGAP